jgi:hypothetical protein
MRVIPTSSREWSALFLLPFKAYTVFGILVFVVWDRFYHQLHSHDWHGYEQFGGIVRSGYMISAAVLLLAGLILASRRKPAFSCFIFGIVGVVIAFVLPAFYPA